MSIPRFNVGEVVGDELGTIGTITHVTPGIQFPYRILEVGGKTARYSDGEHLRLVTPSLTLAPTTTASGVADGAGVTHGCSCGLSKRVPVREQWKFVGRRRHYGYDFWAWELVANPSQPRRVGRIYTDLAP